MWSDELLKNKGFTYVEVLMSVIIIGIFLMIFSQAEGYNYRQRQRIDEINKMTMTAQGVMDAYRLYGRTEALNYSQGYTVDIIEDANTDYTQLRKVTITVLPNVSGLNNITLVSYDTNK